MILCGHRSKYITCLTVTKFLCINQFLEQRLRAVPYMYTSHMEGKIFELFIM